MMIPAMDAVRSNRFGYVSTDSTNVAVIMHDEEVPNRNHGQAWRITRPVCIQTSDNVDIVNVIENADYEKNNFSSDFWEEAARIYRVVSDEYDEDTDTDINCENPDSSFETDFLYNIIHTLNNCGASTDLWGKVLRDAQYHKIEDSKIDGSIDENEQEFSESSFDAVNYIPEIYEIYNWGLYCYSIHNEDIEMDTLWLRIEDETGDIKEFPIIENNGKGSIVSINPKFGSVDSNHLSNEAQESLEEQIIAGETDIERSLTKMVKNTELSDKTEKLVDNATQSEIIM
jgi:hypothetical protein